MSVPTRRILEPIFGNPILRCANSGKVGWIRAEGEAQALNQKGMSGWLANLYGGAQSGDDWAAVYIPVYELPVPDLDEAYWSYRMQNAEVYGVNMVIWIHDPRDFDKRAEVTQAPSHADLEKAAGWNAHELDTSVTQFFFYGEGTTGTGLTAGTQYTWEQFQADTIFKGWTIYRVTLEMGWYSTGTFEDVWVADVKLNDTAIPLRPQFGEEIGRETKSIYQATASDSSTKATIITPGTSHRVRIKNVFMATASATAVNFELYFGTGANMAADTTKGIAFMNLDTDTIASVSIPYGDHGPIGDPDEVVSIRTSANITTNGTFVVVYKEE